MAVVVVLAVALSAFVFAVWHSRSDNRWASPNSTFFGSIAVVWLGGVLASWLYVRGCNLYVVIALHALFNDSAPLVESPVSHQ